MSDSTTPGPPSPGRSARRRRRRERGADARSRERPRKSQGDAPEDRLRPEDEERVIAAVLRSLRSLF